MRLRYRGPSFGCILMSPRPGRPRAKTAAAVAQRAGHCHNGRRADPAGGRSRDQDPKALSSRQSRFRNAER